jgi:hypothetical protein
VVKDSAKEPLSLPPYGYMKDPDNLKRWIVDTEAAEIVRRIYGMTLDGMGTEQIAAALSADKILTPMFYWRSKGLNRGGKVTDREPHHWNSSTIVKILTMQEYCGDIINLKTYAKSFKLKKRYVNENKSVHRDMHEPLVDRTVWERIQEKRKRKTRKRPTSDGEKNMFISTVRKYTRAKKLTERMLNELIERIEVHQSEKVDGVHIQRLTIHYNCVGALEIPETLTMPEITMQTRKGVSVSYSPLQHAI